MFQLIVPVRKHIKLYLFISGAFFRFIVVLCKISDLFRDFETNSKPILPFVFECFFRQLMLQI